ncbi:LacI family DNA-binding transcriptional regulator [Streptomyces candidus]|uniref:DNA-binding LacI/PurR family transcriptional regulator n=1 Tax=Streptomyces candidus TaxID=67283 RepID=A0A7X0HJS6_9ACTN|nr:LacI family DNA-binding transcriptional regulator [Streptomyces candidus]MBB6438951.1 DNA-binding LacI/PurR family transcriptional regulator [Streptomyces candidus]GHH44375.1 LacI family transcriptional regulator [Streptomyces candidus]
MVTLADVARHAGVSASTVSYVLSGKRSISASTRERVESSIQHLGYHPHAGARALPGGRPRVIALMMPLRTDVYVPVMMEIALAVATTVRARGYDILLLTGEEGPSGVRRIERGALADAVILMDVELDDDRLPLLRASARPAALIGMPADTSRLHCVDLDFAAAGALCVEHLAGLGHRDVAVIGEASAVYARRTGFAERTLDGLRTRSRELGVRLLHLPCEGSRTVAATLTRILEQRPATTAFVVQNEAATEPLLTLLRRQRLAVPGKVSVMAVCAEQTAVHASVPLTSIAVPAQKMGRRAAEQVMAQLAGERNAEGEVALFEPELTVRNSTGPRSHETS